MPHSLEGLAKWAMRERWQCELEWVFEQHLGIACEEFDVEIEELPDLLDEDMFVNLWGCAFEDLIAHDIDGRNIADDYLKRRGWKESAGTRAYIRALRQSAMSLYEVSGIRRDEGFFLRDLLRGGEPVWITEKSGTHYLAPWDHLAARIVTVNGRTRMAGGSLSFDRETSEDLIAAFKRMENMTLGDVANQLDRLAHETGEQDDEETREFIDALKQRRSVSMTIDDVLAASASMFTTFWLRNALEMALDLQLPQMFNSDGEPLAWIALRYPLASGATHAEISDALADISALRQESEGFWNWVEEGKRKRRKSGKASETATKRITGNNTTLLGALEVDRRALTLRVNSEGRAQRARALLEPALGKLLRKPKITRETVEDILAKGKVEVDARDIPDPVGDLSTQERSAIMREFFDDHYAEVLDQPVPTLGNVSPRKAAKTNKSKPKVVGWLKDLENHHARLAKGDPEKDYDCSWIWEELGLGAYRPF